MSIELTDDIRKRRFSAPLRAEDMKYYTEHFALAVLRYCFDEYDSLTVCDAPDLQAADKSIGIEVTGIAINNNMAIVGDCLHYWKTGDKRYREKAEQRGATPGETYYILPSVDSDDELSAIESIFAKKLGKLRSYRRKGFRRLGLVMVMDGLPIPVTEMYWADVVRDVQAESPEKYDAVFFAYASALSVYDCHSGRTEFFEIPPADMDALERYARCRAEELIADLSR